MNEDKAREFAKRFGVRMCDENGDTHDEELYCLGVDDIMEMAKALAQPEQKYTTTRNAWTGKATYKCNICGRDDFRSEHAAAFHECGEKAQPEQEPVAWRVSYPNDPELGFWFAEGIGGEGCLNEPLYTTPPQRKEPKQEPVAWIDASSFVMMHQDPRFDRVQWQTTLTLSKVYEGQMPLYTTPPQRTWVGLTDEEIENLARGKDGHIDFAHAIEAKLKEKNS